jgi:hypothetical protein
MPTINERQLQLQSLLDSDEPLTVHRLELPNETANAVVREAMENERTIPAQIRVALKDWLRTLS